MFLVCLRVRVPTVTYEIGIRLYKGQSQMEYPGYLVRARVPRLLNESQSPGYIMRASPRLLNESQSPQVTYEPGIRLHQGQSQMESPGYLVSPESPGYSRRIRVPILFNESQSPRVTQGKPESPGYLMRARVPRLLNESQSPRVT